MIDQTVRRSVQLAVDADAAWRLLTEPEGAASWLGHVDGPVQPGRPVSVREHDGTERTMVVDRVDDGRSVGFTWWVDGSEERASEVSVTVTDTADGGCRVDVVERFVGATAAASCSVLDAGAAWDQRLVGLELGTLLRAGVFA